MNYATFAALTTYTSTATAIAANPANGAAWLLDESLIARDATMPDSGPASQKKSKQVMLASTVHPTIQRNKGNNGVKTTTIGGRSLTYNTKVGGSYQSTKGGGTFVNRETVNNTKTPAIRHKVSWYVTDTSNANGYRRVFGLLEDPTSTSPYRDDDAQVRK
jgi:hypothetical protein